MGGERERERKGACEDEKEGKSERNQMMFRQGCACVRASWEGEERKVRIGRKEESIREARERLKALRSQSAVEKRLFSYEVESRKCPGKILYEQRRKERRGDKKLLCQFVSPTVAQTTFRYSHFRTS